MKTRFNNHSSGLISGCFLLLLLFVLSGCSDSGSNGILITDPPPPPVSNTLTLDYSLTGDQQNPMVMTSAQGSGSVTLDLDSGALNGSIMTAAVEVTAAHIHQGFAGQNGDVVVTLIQDSVDATKWLIPDDTLLSAAEIERFNGGEFYVNVHGIDNPGGEIRGQILPANIKVLWGNLSAGEQMPAVDSAVTGRAALTLNNDTLAVVLHAQTSDLAAATAAHIHQGFAGENGGVVLGLEQDAGDSNHWSAMDTFSQENLDALWAGGLYVNIHSSDHPGGEIRGQLLASHINVLWATLFGDQEVPAVDTIASGRAALTVNNDTLAVVLHAQTSDLADATAAHIHQGFAGENGGVVLGLEQDDEDSNHWRGMGTFTAEDTATLWAGALYVNIHSSDHPGGEIRGQLLPTHISVLWTTLSGDQQVPAVDTIASGRAALTINNDSLTVVLHAMSVDLDATAAHIHQGVAGENGGVVLGLEQDDEDSNHWWGMGTFTAEDTATLWAGGLYVNVHSSNYPGGEIRGQLML